MPEWQVNRIQVQDDIQAFKQQTNDIADAAAQANVANACLHEQNSAIKDLINALSLHMQQLSLYAQVQAMAHNIIQN